MSRREMGIRAKALLALAFTFGFGFVVLAQTLRGFLLDRFLSSETEVMRQELREVKAHLAFLVDDLGEYVAEYSAWDDTWAFLGGENPTYVEDNFTFNEDAYKKLSLVAILTASGDLVAGTSYDEVSMNQGPLQPDFLEALRSHPAWRAHATPSGVVKGLTSLGGRPLLLVSRPIVRNYFVGPIRGTMLMGQILDDRTFRNLMGPGGSLPTLHAVADPNFPAGMREALRALQAGTAVYIDRTSGEEMVGYTLLNDLDMAPAFMVRLAMGRSIYANGLMTLNLLLLAFGGVVLVTGGAYVLLLEGVVLRRIIRLGVVVERVGAGLASEEEIVARGSDEICQLAERVREGFVARRRLQQELEESNSLLAVRVEERTRSLQETIVSLNLEIALRRGAETQIAALERFQRNVLDTMASGLVVFDENLVITLINPAAREMLRVTSSYVGRPLARAIPETFAESIDAAFRADATPVRGEVSTVLPDGRESIFGYVLSRVSPAEGRGVHGILLFLDLTDERRLEMERQRLNRLTTLGEFSAQIAHELRNPLTAMSSTVQYLSARKGPDREALRVIGESIERMEGIIRQMRLLSREMPMVRASIDLRDLVARLLEFLEANLRERAITSLFPRPASPLLVRGDPAQLHQALLNLMLNALQAMPQGGRLRVRLARGRASADGGPAPVMILIADSGVGIAPEVAGRIFDPFFTTRDSGSGLGLSIADKIVRDHNGSIRFTSRPGHGACFVVILPGAPREV